MRASPTGMSASVINYQNMLKKPILSVLLFAALSSAVPASAAIAVEPEATYQDVSRQGKQENVEGEWVNSTEKNTVQVSELTRKAIQAQKARNAEENDSFGGAITIIAMTIVIAALVVLSLLFLGFGKISAALQKRKKRAAHGVTGENVEGHHDELDSGEVIAAISMALAEHLGQGHDMEDTILTIRRMRKAYSPWNSKIYNMRVIPEHARMPMKKLK